MNECVQRFIERRKGEIAEEKEREKKILLAKIPEFQIREYSGLRKCNDKFPLWDEVKNRPYRFSSVDISDSDFESIKPYLSLDEEDEIEKEKMVSPSNAADKTLSVLAVICLIFAFLGLIVSLFGLSGAGSNRWDPTLFIIGISAFGVLLVEWAILRLLVNISVRLRQINSKLS